MFLEAAGLVMPGSSALRHEERWFKLHMLYGCVASSKGPIHQELFPSQWCKRAPSKACQVHDVGSS